MNKRLYPVFTSTGILIIFTIIYLIQGNYEFLAYIIAAGILIYLIIKTDSIYKFPAVAMWGFSLWIILHMIGGSLYINGIKLYDTMLINIVGSPYNILKYDQLVHMYCYFVLTLFVYSLVKNIADNKFNTKTSILIIFLASSGIGALNEIIEFSTIVFLNSTGVGGYINNALDLVFNALGAIIAIIYSRKYMDK